MILRIAVLLVLISSLGCGGSPPPEAELEAARQAVQNAQEAGADVYSQQGFEEASQALEAARREIAAQGEKSSFSRDYTQALQLIETAKTKAEDAASGVASRKVQVNGEAEGAAQQAEQALEVAAAALRRAPRGKGTRADVAALTQDLERARSTLARAQQELSNDNPSSALALFREAQSQAEKVTASIPARR